MWELSVICKKGIILAGGKGSRLYPLTLATSKQLLPIYDKPVIYYPLTTLMLAGIKEILIISTARDIQAIKNLFGDGRQYGISIQYKIQIKPNGLPEAFIIGEEFIDHEPVAMILGDNFFHGNGLSTLLLHSAQNINGVHIFVYPVDDPSAYGVVDIDKNGKIIGLVEKPEKFISHLAITGLYYFDGSASSRAKKLQPSARGELEIVDLIRSYLNDQLIDLTLFGRGYVWFDVGVPKTLLHASNYVEMIQSRQGIIIASPEEVAWNMGYINNTDFLKLIKILPDNPYRKYLKGLLKTIEMESIIFSNNCEKEALTV